MTSCPPNAHTRRMAGSERLLAKADRSGLPGSTMQGIDPS